MSVGDFIQVEIKGLPELEAALNRLAEDTSRRVLRNVARSAMGPLKDRIAANAPRGTEPLKKGRTIRLHEGIIMSSTIKSDGVRGATVVVYVGLRVKPKDRSVFYGRYQEYGTVKMAARPFMRPAFDSMAESTLELFGKKLGDGIEKAVKR